VSANQCMQSNCIRILANFWSVNYTDPMEESTTGNFNPLDYVFSGESGDVFAPMFEVR